jgi:hypothetical protein
MYRTFFFLLVFIVSANPSLELKAGNTDNSAFQNRSVTAQFGIGNDLKKSSGEITIPLIWGCIEYNIQKEAKVPLSFGGVLGYAGNEDKERVRVPADGTYIWRYSYSYYLFGARAAYHFTSFIRVKDLDTYAGVFLGYVYVQSEVHEPEGVPSLNVKEKGNYSIWGLYGGARYFITDNTGVFLEFGATFYTLSGGVTRRF